MSYELDQETRFLVDLDGTLISGKTLLPGSEKFYELYQDRFVIVSNNSTHTAQDMAKQLDQIGLPMDVDKIILAGEYSIQFIQEKYPDAKVFLLANSTIQKRAIQAGVNLVTDNADVVLVCRDTEISYEKLALVTKIVANGAILIAANPDFSHPGINGEPIPETGAIVKAIEACSGKRVSHYVGKPGGFLFQEAMKKFNWRNKDTVVIGDNITTDISGAKELNLHSFLLGTCKHADALNMLDLLYKLNNGFTLKNSL